MNSIFLAMILTSGLPDGSLIFCKIPTTPKGPVEKIASQWSGDLGHSAIIFDNFVYEATWPRVKRTPLKEWIGNYQYKNGRSFFVMKPKKPFSAWQIDKMKKFADSELGRRYMARGLWQDRETKGTFCSQYVSEVLEQAGFLKSAHHRETPQSLYLEVSDKYIFSAHYTKGSSK